MKTQEEILEVRLRLKEEIRVLISEDVDRMMSGEEPLNSDQISLLRYKYNLTEAASNRLITQGAG